jgi:hypothetical protein
MPSNRPPAPQTDSGSDTRQVAQFTALIMESLRGDTRFEAWYDPDRWGGVIGLADDIAGFAHSLHRYAPAPWGLGEGTDLYLTADRTADYYLTDARTTQHWSTCYHVWPEIKETV